MGHHRPSRDHGSEPARIAVVGSINHDSIVQVAHLPRPGETVSGYAHRSALGGKGANQAVAAARAGAEVELVGTIGDDTYGAGALEQLTGYGVGTTQVTRSDATSTGLAHIHVADDGENSIVLVPGANGLTQTMSQAGLGVLTWAEVVLLQLEVPIALVTQAARQARALGRRVILTPAPAADLPDELLENVDVLLPNQVEVTQITGMLDADAACQALAGRGVNVLNTRGPAGSVWFGRDGSRIEVPAVKVSAQDTTGAGDCFAGNFAAHWARTDDVRASMTWAAAAAALSVQRPGAAPSMPTRDEVDSALRADLPSHRKETHAQSR